MKSRFSLAPSSLHIRKQLFLLSLLAALLLVAACGGGSGDSSGDDTSGEAAPKSGGVPATPEPKVEPDLAFGEEAYVKLCVECHGATGEGEADKAETIVGVELDHATFVDLLRSGGGYGNEHIFGPTKISDDGIVSLLAYVQTLSGE